jgi:RNA polymerase sigma factor (TIGR02999 family)
MLGMDDIHPDREKTKRLPSRSIGDVDDIVDAICNNNFSSEELLPVVYDELRQLAAAKLAHEKPGQTIQATALVHEAYLRLVSATSAQSWDSHGHFFSAAAEAMRRILVDNARRKLTLKSGGANTVRVELADVASVAVAGRSGDASQTDIIALNDALDKLAIEHARRAELIKLRFFTGLTNQQAAEVLGISCSTADNDWAYAKTWLLLEMSGGS